MVAVVPQFAAERVGERRVAIVALRLGLHLLRARGALAGRLQPLRGGVALALGGAEGLAVLLDERGHARRVRLALDGGGRPRLAEPPARLGGGPARRLRRRRAFPRRRLRAFEGRTGRLDARARGGQRLRGLGERPIEFPVALGLTPRGVERRPQCVGVSVRRAERVEAVTRGDERGVRPLAAVVRALDVRVGVARPCVGLARAVERRRGVRAGRAMHLDRRAEGVAHRVWLARLACCYVAFSERIADGRPQQAERAPRLARSVALAGSVGGAGALGIGGARRLLDRLGQRIGIDARSRGLVARRVEFAGRPFGGLGCAGGVGLRRREGRAGLALRGARLAQRRISGVEARLGGVEFGRVVRLDVADRLAADGARVAGLEPALQRDRGVLALRQVECLGAHLALRLGLAQARARLVGVAGGGLALGARRVGLARGGVERLLPRPQPRVEVGEAACLVGAVGGGALGLDAGIVGGVRRLAQRVLGGERRSGGCGEAVEGGLTRLIGAVAGGAGRVRLGAQSGRLVGGLPGGLDGRGQFRRRRFEGGARLLALVEHVGLAFEAAVLGFVVPERLALAREVVALGLRVGAARLGGVEGGARGLCGALGGGVLGGGAGCRGVGVEGGAGGLGQRGEQRRAPVERLGGGGAGGVVAFEGGDRVGRGSVEAHDLDAKRGRGALRARRAVAGRAARLLVAFEAEQAREDVAALALVAAQERVERALRQQHGLGERREVEAQQLLDVPRHVARAVSERLPLPAGALAFEARAEVGRGLAADAVARAAHAEVEPHGHRLRAVRHELERRRADARHLAVERPRHRVEQRRFARARRSGDGEQPPVREVEHGGLAERREAAHLQPERPHGAAPASAARASSPSASSRSNSPTSSGAGAVPCCDW